MLFFDKYYLWLMAVRHYRIQFCVNAHSFHKAKRYKIQKHDNALSKPMNTIILFRRISLLLFYKIQLN